MFSSNPQFTFVLTKLRFFKPLLLFFLFACFMPLLGSIASAEDEKVSALRAELSARHPSMSVSTLIEVMGSEDSLVSGLLELRRVDKPPFIGPRAESLLISFSEREDVQSALLEDVSDPTCLGLGSVVLSSYSKIKDENFKAKIKDQVNLLLKEEQKKSKSAVADRYKSLLEEIEQ